MDLRYLLDVIAKAVLSDDLLEQLHVHKKSHVSLAPGACINEALLPPHTLYSSTAHLHFLVQSHNHCAFHRRHRLAGLPTRWA